MRIKGGLILFSLLLLFIQCTTPYYLGLSSSPTNRSSKSVTNWVVTNPETVYDTEITLTGNLIVSDSLTLNHVTLRINCSNPGQFGIQVYAGGFLCITNGSKVVAVNSSAPYFFKTYEDASLRITNSEIHNCGYPGPNQDAWGLFIDNADYVLIHNSTLSNNYVGLVVYGHSPFGTAPVIENCIISNNTLDGVWTGYTFAVPRLHGNWILDNGRDGVMSWGSTELWGNVIARNRIGLNLQNSPLGVMNNTIVFNRQSGILINTTWAHIEGNVIAYNNGSGIIGPGSEAEIRYNNLFGNGGWGIAEAIGVVNASLNWWGNSSGPEVTNSPDAIDPEEVQENLIIEPWLTEPYPAGMPPSIGVLQPTEGSIVWGICTVVVFVDAVLAVDHVDFFIDGKWMASDNNSPFEWEWNTIGFMNGYHLLMVVASDVVGNQVSQNTSIFVNNWSVPGTIIFFSLLICIPLSPLIIIGIFVDARFLRKPEK